MYNTERPTQADLPSRRKLVRSTLIAFVTAAVLLVTVVLPAEYAIDPTGVGKRLGLTDMGEIKQQLAQEAAQDKAQEAADTALDPKATQILPPPETASPQTATQTAPPSATPTEPVQPAWRDTITLTLAPGEAAEIKLIMQKDDVVTYEWDTHQGHLNSDLHGNGAKKVSTSYRKGRAETSDAGILRAEFDGRHGWFWRNRSDVNVNLTFRVTGAYSDIKRVL